MSEFESVEEDLKFMADLSDSQGDSENSMMFMRYLGRIRTLATQRDEGLAREAELQAELASAKSDKEAYGHNAVALRLRVNQLKQRLAEAEKPQPLFVATVLRKLRRFVECMEDGQGADIGRHWFDVLTRLGLLNRVQRSPALWELTDEGEQFLASPGCADGEKAS